MKTKHKYTVENDIIIYHDRERLSADMKKFKEAWITVSDEKPTRSNQQNRYYWGHVVDTLSKEFGYTPEEIHDILKFKFLGIQEINFKGEEIIRVKSTTELNTAEFEDFLLVVRGWAMELNVKLLKPNEWE